MQQRSGIRIQQGVLLVHFWDGTHKWYRLSRRYTDNIMYYFSGLPNFKYAKCYEFDRKTRNVGRQLGYFGVKNTGEWYENWNV